MQLAPPQYTLWVYDFEAGTLTPMLSAASGVETVEPVILQARVPAPTYIPDSVAASAAQQNLISAGVGILDIGSVYDFDGVDVAMPDLATQANPGNASFYTRPLRFIRLVKSVEIPGKTVRKINNSAFGPANMGMREILGYAPIQPDGSVQVQVPANVPFTIDLLDANGRRVAARHTSWLQVLPGETKSCSGCHSTANMTSHGRSGLSMPVNTGAANATQFPGTNPMLQATTGETMAQTLSRITCISPKNTVSPCSQVPSADVLYANIWTTGVTLPTGDVDANIALAYADLSTPAPTNANCAVWSAQCRITIHYASASSPVSSTHSGDLEFRRPNFDG